MMLPSSLGLSTPSSNRLITWFGMLVLLACQAAAEITVKEPPDTPVLFNMRRAEEDGVIGMMTYTDNHDKHATPEPWQEFEIKCFDTNYGKPSGIQLYYGPRRTIRHCTVVGLNWMKYLDTIPQLMAQIKPKVDEMKEMNTEMEDTNAGFEKKRALQNTYFNEKMARKKMEFEKLKKKMAEGNMEFEQLKKKMAKENMEFEQLKKKIARENMKFDKKMAREMEAKEKAKRKFTQQLEKKTQDLLKMFLDTGLTAKTLEKYFRIPTVNGVPIDVKFINHAQPFAVPSALPSRRVTHPVTRASYPSWKHKAGRRLAQTPSEHALERRRLMTRPKNHSAVLEQLLEEIN